MIKLTLFSNFFKNVNNLDRNKCHVGSIFSSLKTFSTLNKSLFLDMGDGDGVDDDLERLFFDFNG